MDKQFHELTDLERAELEKSLKDRAKAQGRDLLEDVICAYRPMLDCECECCREVFKNF